MKENPCEKEKRNLEISEKRGDEVRALFKLRCKNLEEGNKYWIKKSKRKCIFCGEGKNNLEHYVKDCVETKIKFTDLREEEKKILKRIWDNNLDDVKGEVLRKLWKEREKLFRNKKKEGKENKRIRFWR